MTDFELFRESVARAASMDEVFSSFRTFNMFE